jgi:hypothetical protein
MYVVKQKMQKANKIYNGVAGGRSVGFSQPHRSLLSPGFPQRAAARAEPAEVPSWQATAGVAVAGRLK